MGAEVTHCVTLSDGQERNVSFTMGTLRRLRDLTGLKLSDFRTRPEALVDELPTMVWAALDPGERAKLKPEDVAELIHIRDMTRIAGEIMACLPDAEETPTEAAGAPAANSHSNGAGPSADLLSGSPILNSGISP